MPIRNLFLALLLYFLLNPVKGQEDVQIDGRLQPILDQFFEECRKYDIPYYEKLFQLKDIDIVQDLPLEEDNTVLGMVARDQNGQIDRILISWAALLDPEILKIVAFHEFAHHFLDFKHTCQDCDEIMAVTNTSYFNIARDWDNQVAHLFLNSPKYRENRNRKDVASAFE